MEGWTEDEFKEFLETIFSASEIERGFARGRRDFGEGY